MRSADGNLLVDVTVQPRASKNTVVGVFNHTLKIATTAPPVEGKANSEIIALLAKFFEIPKSTISLKSGQQSKTKRFVLPGLSVEEADSLFAKKIPPPKNRK
nr:YggU family protein [Desulfobulbaceae bacterium]